MIVCLGIDLHKAKPILQFDFAGSHIERSEARIAKLAISHQLSVFSYSKDTYPQIYAD